jgi:hypothetical protein
VRGVALIQLMTVAGLILGGCARDPFVTERDETYAGEWLIPHQIDRITGAELPSAYVFAEASNSNVDFPRVSSLLLTCIDGAPSIRFAFDFKIGSNRNTVLGYRFDGKPGHATTSARGWSGETRSSSSKTGQRSRPSSASLPVRRRCMSGSGRSMGAERPSNIRWRDRLRRSARHSRNAICLNRPCQNRGGRHCPASIEPPQTIQA